MAVFQVSQHLRFWHIPNRGARSCLSASGGCERGNPHAKPRWRFCTAQPFLAPDGKGMTAKGNRVIVRARWRGTDWQMPS